MDETFFTINSTTKPWLTLFLSNESRKYVKHKVNVFFKGVGT